jgi:DNA-binding FadR family transcriptional regulator
MANERNIGQRSNLSQDVAEELIELIKAQKYAPGDKIPNEFELAEQLNVARSTIREAVKMLVSRNVLEIRRGKGTFLAENPGFVEDPWGLDLVTDKFEAAQQLLELRLIVEPSIVTLAAVRATDEEIANIRHFCNLCEEDIRAGRSHEDNDIAFHLAVADSAHNPFAANVLKQTLTQSVSLFVEITENKLSDETIEAHALIAEGIEKHDAPLARRGIELQLSHTQFVIENHTNKN